MRSRASAIALSGLLFLTAGCFEIEQTINLERDMSGTASMRIGVDMEPMVVIMAQMKHDMDGKSGAVTKEEIAAARADFKKQSASKPKEDIALAKSEAQKELPKGIKLLDMSTREEEMRMISDFKFAFDNLSNLVKVTLPSKGDDPTQKNVMDSPFEGLEVEEDGKTITIHSKPQNPADSVESEAKEQAPKMDPEMEKMMRDAFKNLRVAYRITAPFEVVRHNATRQEGKTLIWEYDLATFEKMEKSKKAGDLEVRVVYKK